MACSPLWGEEGAFKPWVLQSTVDFKKASLFIDSADLSKQLFLWCANGSVYACTSAHSCSYMHLFLVINMSYGINLDCRQASHFCS